ncbi:hypothetical protein [Thalassobius sp. Cn5-15]|uniref:hypothetical protein n=1 Tax=Thalassobius sp. Cn5-15 TaxID=2917763 RepID=UPI001EF25CAB|nr:hypothetical protein [Thalassobius sp. Cn5-15]MCG7493086.1 hypothetical protein [Thalassobius sp. Cn5-15]
MKNLSAYCLMIGGCAVVLGLEVASVAMAAQAPGVDGVFDTPVLVVAPPWSGGAEAVVAAAGGAVVGPTQAPLSVLATGASADGFRQSGAWFLLDPGALSYFCVTKEMV